VNDHRFDACIVDRARHARARLVAKPVQPPRGEPPAPFAHGVGVEPKFGGDVFALRALRARQHDARAHRHRLARLAPRGQRRKLSTLVPAQNNLRRRASTSHRTLLAIPRRLCHTRPCLNLRTFDSGH
jgi:hypothetical protein